MFGRSGSSGSSQGTSPTGGNPYNCYKRRKEGFLQKLRRAFKQSKKSKKLKTDDEVSVPSGIININTVGVIVGNFEEDHLQSEPSIDNHEKQPSVQVGENVGHKEREEKEGKLDSVASSDEKDEELRMYKEMHEVRKYMILKEKKFQEERLDFYKFQLETQELFGPKIFAD